MSGQTRALPSRGARVLGAARAWLENPNRRAVFPGDKPLDLSVANATSATAVVKESPVTGEPLWTATFGSREDVDAAVNAATAAQALWAQSTPRERARIIGAAGRLVHEHSRSLEVLECLDTGRCLSEMPADMASVVDCLEFVEARAVGGGGNGQTVPMPLGSWAYTLKQPIGVTAGIGAWNYPLQGAVWKAAPALAAGNAIIFKPAPTTPLTALAMEDIMQQAGLPDGLFQVILGDGDVGHSLATHSAIGKVSFTGSAETGKKVASAAAASNLKKVTMELGGKSPLIVFGDADVEQAVTGALMGNFYSSGQVCSNGTRVFVHRDIREQFMARLVARTKMLRVGAPWDDTTDVGPLVSKEHLDKVQGYVQLGLDEGATLVYGGTRVSGEGNFMVPAIFDRVTDTMRIAREEIFGPVMAVLDFEDVEDVVARANDTDYGLSAGIFTNDLTRAHSVAARLRAGTMWINNYNLAPADLPWGGVKLSGLGRENGVDCLDSWTQETSVYVEANTIETAYR